MTAATPLRLIREDATPMAECPNCGAHLALGAEGATWSVHTPRDVAERLIPLLGGLEREELWVVLLDIRNHVTGQVQVYKGNVSASLVRVAELFTEAVRGGNPRLLLCHNHPSGDPSPSPDDLRLTAEAIAAGRLLGIEVLDHLVIAGGTYSSLRERGVRFDG